MSIEDFFRLDLFLIFVGDSICSERVVDYLGNFLFLKELFKVGYTFSTYIVGGPLISLAA